MRGEGAYTNFISLRDTLGNADNEADFIFNGVDDGVRGGGRRDVEHSRVRLRLPNGLPSRYQ